MEHFSALPQTEIISPKKQCSRHSMFHSFLSDDIKKDASTTSAHSKRLIKLLKEQKVMTPTLSKIWEILIVVQSNIYVPLQYTLCQFCPNVSQL